MIELLCGIATELEDMVPNLCWTKFRHQSGPSESVALWYGPGSFGTIEENPPLMLYIDGEHLKLGLFSPMGPQANKNWHIMGLWEGNILDPNFKVKGLAAVVDDYLNNTDDP